MKGFKNCYPLGGGCRTQKPYPLGSIFNEVNEGNQLDLDLTTAI